MDKDHNTGIKTIPILFGKDRTIKYIGIATIIPITAVVYYIYTYLFSNTKAVAFVLLLIIAPLLFFMIKSFTVESEKYMNTLKLILKIVLITSSLSIFLYQFILYK